MISLCYIFLNLVLFLTTIPTSQSLWQVDFALNVYGGASSNQIQAPSAICTQNGNGLSASQRSECTLQPDAALAIAEGALYGLKECSRQLSNRRWNCSYDDPHFKNGLQQNTKETAYVQAITSAGIVYSIARACSRDKIDQCSCDNTERAAPEDGDFQWGGCGDNLEHGYNYAKRFADSASTSGASGVLNEHNSEAGRLAVTEHYRKECYCHGISGSCSIQTCWVVAPPLKHIGGILTRKYANALQVSVSSTETTPTLDAGGDRIGNKELVYTQNSPSYCEKDSQFGSSGTQGRECNRKRGSVKNCDVMCCSRGFRRKIITYSEDCNCKFVWCCELKCQKCTHVEERYYCR